MAAKKYLSNGCVCVCVYESICTYQWLLNLYDDFSLENSENQHDNDTPVTDENGI